MKGLHMASFILLIVGGLNWGLVGINQSWNIVETLFGQWSGVLSAVYILVGLAAIFEAVTHKGNCKYCEGGETPVAQ